MKKRLLSVLLTVALGAGLVPGALAEEAHVARPARLPDREETVLIEEPWEGEEPAQALADGDVQPDYAGAAEALHRGIGKGEASIDLLPYHIPTSQENLDALYHYIFYRYGELFVLGQTSREDGTGWFATSTYFTKYVPAYITNYAAALAFYNEKLDAIVAQVPEEFTNAEKVLFIHDYLAAHYEYDYEHDNDHKISDAYNFLKEGKGVCQAYMLVFSALMDRLGIPVSYAESNILNHAWNVVKLDGKWYHVDATWDDPAIGVKGEASSDVLGAARHDYFLLSDETNDARRAARAQQMKIENYAKDFLCGEDYIRGAGTVTCTDKTYETGLYADADSPVVYLAGEDSWYYVSTDKASEGGGLYRWREGEKSATRLGDYSGYSGGMAPLVEYEGSLFFSGPDSIRRYEPATGELTTLFTQTDPAAEPLSGMRIADGKLSYKLRKTEEVKTCDVELLPWHEAEGGAFSYYYNFGGLGLKLPELRKGRVFAAWYDPDSGQMVRLAAAKDVPGRYGVPVADKDLICAVFVLKDDGSLVPVQDKFTVHPVSDVPAE